MSEGFLSYEDAVLAVVDVQESHFPHVLDSNVVLDRIVRMVEVAKILDVPVVWTEHYPPGFGHTVPPLAEALEGVTKPILKRDFGCFLVPEFVEAVRATGKKYLYLIGAETPICILQTAMGALDHDMTPVIVADCVAARHRLDHDLALRRMRGLGAELVTWEMLAYEWLRTADHPKFKQILMLVKGASNHQQLGGVNHLNKWGGAK